MTTISSCIAPGDGSFVAEFEDGVAVEAHGKLRTKQTQDLGIGVVSAMVLGARSQLRGSVEGETEQWAHLRFFFLVLKSLGAEKQCKALWRGLSLVFTSFPL